MPTLFKDMISGNWTSYLDNELSKEYIASLETFIEYEYNTKKVFPIKENIFSALNNCPFKETKVVIIGQDPYHGFNQANGLAFSVNDGVKIPPSLKNIYKELNNDLSIPISESGNLSRWTKQGVLLLNSVLTVNEGLPGSHQNRGWESLTDKIISILSDQNSNIVFLLWGKFAQSKSILIDPKKHLILKSTHPSPFSAYRGFLGCKHFSKTNDYLIKNNIKAIDWEV